MFWQPGGTERRGNISATPCLGQETMEDFPPPPLSFLPSTGNGVQQSINEGGSVVNFQGERNEDWIYYSS